jgi:D-alanyl-D-alanine endopeptidase (penicillin-binding protein 7)
VHTSGPSIRARSAIIADLDRGEVLWARRPDASAPVASLTKLASALTLVSLDRTSLDRELCITPEQWPVRPGAHSRFETGACHTGWELFGAALVHSDNRGAMAMPALVGLSMDDFVQHMNLVSRDLGARAEWADPSGLDDGNNASARDMLKLVVAAASAPDVALAASARSWTLDRDHGARVVGTTNRTIDAWETLAAKTGYTDTAKYCFTTVIRTSSGRTLALALLGAPSDDGRFADARALVAWAEQVDAAADGVADAR